MVFCYGFLSTILIVCSALLSIALLIASNVGTVGEHAATSSIFLLELNMANLDASEIYSGASGITASELGFSDAYMFGMYGYCRGTQSSSSSSDDSIWEDISFDSTSCTKSSTSYEIDPVTFAVDEINDYNRLGLTVTKDDVNLPGGLNAYMTTAQNLSRVIYICSIIAIVLSFFSILCEIICWCYGSIIVVFFFQSLAFLSALISSGCATGAVKYIERQFNNNSDTFGITAKLSRNYLVLTWVGTFVSLFTVFLILFSRCCSVKVSTVKKEERTLA